MNELHPDLNYFLHYRPIMNAMTDLDRDHLDALKMAEEPSTDLEICYSPHTAWTNPDAKVVFIGICPGFEQMKLSFDLIREHQDLSEEEALKAAKVKARFGKSMRRNLIDLADRTELPRKLGIESCAELFDPDCQLMDNTALIPWPVFKDGKNYTGHSPKIERSPMLNTLVHEQLEKVIATYPDALFIPLGKCVDEQVIRSGLFKDRQVLHGFPHPSGANGHRFRQLQENLNSINETIENFPLKKPGRTRTA